MITRTRALILALLTLPSVSCAMVPLTPAAVAGVAFLVGLLVGLLAGWLAAARVATSPLFQSEADPEADDPEDDVRPTCVACGGTMPARALRQADGTYRCKQPTCVSGKRVA